MGWGWGWGSGWGCMGLHPQFARITAPFTILLVMSLCQVSVFVASTNCITQNLQKSLIEIKGYETVCLPCNATISLHMHMVEVHVPFTRKRVVTHPRPSFSLSGSGNR